MSSWLAVMVLSTAVSGAPPTLVNGGFETVGEVTLGADGRVAGWTLERPPVVPTGWSLNSAYPGHLALGTDDPHGGDRYVRISGEPNQPRPAHLYQMCQGLEVGRWYRVTLWVRGGPVIVQTYDYYQDAHIAGQMVTAGRSDDGRWRPLTGWLQPGGEGYLRSALALVAGPGATADVDDVAIEAMPAPDAAAIGPAATFTNDLARLTIGAGGTLNELTDVASGQSYAADGPPFPFATVVRNDVPIPVRTVRQEGDLLHLEFVDPDVRVDLKVTVRPLHVLFEVAKVEPDDVDRFQLELPVKRLATVGAAFGATYDETFGMCLFGTTVNVYNQPTSRGPSVQGLGCACTRAHGLVGAGFALVAAPRARFKEAIMDAERANGLPCPILGGEWSRDSEAVRRSYLFATSVKEADVETLIEYAKIGGFGTIIFLKDSWLANHGHFTINSANFPDGVASVQRAVAKIHAAGLDAGVHVFGPSISPNDPYVTPVPDPGLAGVPCPPLAEAVDEKATTLTLSGEPNLPPKGPRSQAFPGYFVQLGDEIVRYGDAEVGPPFRFVGCQRGALGTTAAAHPAGSEVKGLLNLWSFFLVDPDSKLADEVTTNFATVFNACGFDMVYFDASDGVSDPYLDRWYYLNRMHQLYYSKFDHDVLYQTSNGTGSNLLWHIVPRSASADGHGDIKGYLDERWPGILHMADNWTRADIGWYYWFRDVRPDQMEYVCAKALGVDGSISMETSREALERLSQSRQMLDAVGRWERCRRDAPFGPEIKELLRQPQHDFKVFQDAQGKWQLYRAVYQEPAVVDVLDGTQNTWTLQHDGPDGALLGVEVLRGARVVAAADYASPEAKPIEDFAAAEAYRLGPDNPYEKFVLGGDKVLSPQGPVRKDVSQEWRVSTEDVKVGPRCLVYAADNQGPANGWCGLGRRFTPTLDLSACAGIGLWLHGDGKYESVRIQLRDTAGKPADWVQAIDFTGWRLLTLPFPAPAEFDRAKAEYLLFYFNGMPASTKVEVRIDSVRGLPALTSTAGAVEPVLTLNGRTIAFGTRLEPGQALTVEGPLGVTLWPGGMTEGRQLEIDPDGFRLQPGDNTVTLSTTDPDRFPGDLTVLLYRLWPLDE